MDKHAAGDTVVEAGRQAVRDDRHVWSELLEAAYAEPCLRQLFPWTGMGELHFSRCTDMVVQRLPTGRRPAFIGTPEGGHPIRVGHQGRCTRC
ncbi:DUF6193 family natural product biosynthesis protein [Streptomyces hiroshimensis]